MANLHRPRRGSLAFSPRKRAKSQVPTMRSWSEGNKEPKGIETILANEGSKLSDFHCEVLNTIPGQGTATVRTEEAVWATLSVLNLVR
jgi:predicted SPOUT superfamily RNA methylase MTH1